MPNDLNELSEESLENDNYIVKKEEDNAVTLDEKQLSSSSDTTSLKKADLSNLGYNAGLRGRYKKSEKAVDSDVNEKLLSAAHSLLELSGKSPKDARKQRPATKTPLNIVTSEKSNYIDEDVAVIAHQPVGEFKPMKSMVKEDKPDIPVKPRFKEIRTDSADPFDDKEEEELGSSDHAALQEKEYIPIWRVLSH